MLAKLGVGTYKEIILPDLDFYLSNFQIIELQDFIMPASLDNPGLVRDYKEMLDGWGGELSLHGPYLHLVPTSLDHRVKEVAEFRYLQAVDAAHKLGASRVIIHSFYDLHTGFSEYDDMWMEDNLIFWNSFLDRIEGCGVSILMENLHDRNPATFAKLVSQIGRSSFGACLDLGHSHCFSPSHPAIWANLVPCSYFHISDNDGISDSHSLIGQGRIDFASISDELINKAGLCLVSEARAPISHQFDSLKGLQALIMHAQKQS